MRIRYVVIVLSTAASINGCTSIVTTSNKDDPFEDFNRKVFSFNENVDTFAFKPIAKSYQRIVPKLVRDKVTNFFSNINDVYIAANNIMQFHISDATSDIMRLLINTIFGIGGLFDVATQANLPKHNTDFGTTIGLYGIPSGPYLVLPLIGPGVIRDYVGLMLNYAINPLSYFHDKSFVWIAYGLNFINTRESLIGMGNVLDEAALDKYSFVRNIYLQSRQSLSNYAHNKIDSRCEDNTVDALLPKYDLPSQYGTVYHR